MLCVIKEQIFLKPGGGEAVVSLVKRGLPSVFVTVSPLKCD